MQLTPVMQRYVIHWGEMGTRWGINRSVAQIQALLYLAPEPLHAEEIVETLGMARSNVSVGLKELVSWRLVQTTHTLGDRRDFFVAQKDPWEVVRLIVEARRQRELDPTVGFLKDCAATLESDKETPPHVRDQILGQLEFMQTFMGWYNALTGLPQKTLLKMMRLGHRLAKVIGT
jgi:DNA-binding transcriptional regulator GbsR (MarR family)